MARNVVKKKKEKKKDFVEMLLRRTVQNISFLPTSSAHFCIVYATR